MIKWVQSLLNFLKIYNLGLFNFSFILLIILFDINFIKKLYLPAKKTITTSQLTLNNYT